jgi:hypothetical protein
MQVTARAYLMAGLAAAGAGALALAPMPSLAPQDVKVPTVEAPVALAAQPSLTDLITLGVVDSSTLAAAGFSSGANANTFLSADTQLLGASFSSLIPLVQSNPQTYGPLALASVAFLPTSVIDLTEPQFTGVNAGGQNLDGSYTLPGVANTKAPVITVSPPSFQNVPTVAAPINAAAVKVATDFDSVSKAFGGPSNVAKTMTTSAQAVGTSVIQAQGLVRTAAVGTAQGVATAAIAGNPQGVSNAIQTGAGNIQKAIAGDPSVQLVDPATGKVNTGNPTKNTAAPVKRLGAIGTVSSTVQKAASDISNAVTNTK